MNNTASRVISCIAAAALFSLLLAPCEAGASIVVRALANPSKVQAGERLRFAATISNTGPATQTVTVSATVPAKTSVNKSELSLAAYCNGVASYTACQGGQVLQFVPFNVAAGASVILEYPALISTTTLPSEGGSLTSAISAKVGTTTVGSAAASALYSATADKQPAIASSAFPAQALPGTALTYTLRYANPGTAGVAANITFTIPAGMTFASASDGGVSSAGTVTWTLGTVAAGTSGQRSVVLQTASSAVAGAQIVTDAVLRNPTNQTILADAKLATGVGNATVTGLVVSAAATPSSAAAGQRVRYALTVSNTSTSTRAVYVQATVPDNTTVTKAELSMAAYCDGVASYTTCNAGQTLEFVAYNVPAHGSATILYPALVSSTAPPLNGRLLNSEIWVQDGVVGNEYAANVAATAASTALQRLQVNASALPAQALAGATIVYSLAYSNPGAASVAANLTFAIPAGTTFVSASDGGTSAAGTVTWHLGSLAPGAFGRRAVAIKTASTAVPGSQVVTGAALRDPTTQALLADAKFSTGVGAATVTNLNVSAAATASTAAAGNRVRYAVTVSNAAAATHTLYLQATVPLNTTVAKAELSLAAYCDGVASYATCGAGQTLQFVGYNVPAGGSATWVFPALVSTTVPPSNGRLLQSDVWLQDATIGNEYVLTVDAVAAGSAPSQLQITSSALPAQAFAGGNIAYALTFGNPGAAGAAANLVFPLPAGTTLVSASDGGTSAAGAVTWPLGTLAAGAFGRRTVVVKTSATAAPGSQLVTDAALRNPTTQAVLADAVLSTGLGNATVASLNVSGAATPTFAAAGQRVRYAVTVSNSATATHTVYVQATVPANTAVAKAELSLAAYCDGVASYTSCAAGQTLQFVGFNVPGGGSVTVLYYGVLSTTTPPTNGRLLNSDVWVQDATNGNEYLLNTAAVGSSAALKQLQVVSNAGPAQVLAGGSITYTLTYGNPGGAGTAANLTFAVPIGTSFVSASNAGVNTNGTVSWSLGTVAAGASGTRTVIVKAAGTVAAGSQVVSDVTLRNPSTQVLLAGARLATGVGKPAVTSLTVAAAASPAAARPGQTVHYTVKVSSNATAAHTVYVQATVPANSTVAKTSQTPAAYCDGVASYTSCAAGQTLEFVGVNVPASGTVSVTYSAVLSTAAPASNGTLITSNAWVQDATIGNVYQVSATAIASTTAPAVSGAVDTDDGAGAVVPPGISGRPSSGLHSASAPRTTTTAVGRASALVQPGKPKTSHVAASAGAARVILVLGSPSLEAPATSETEARWPWFLAQRARLEGNAAHPLVVEQGNGAAALLRPVRSAGTTAPAPQYIVFLDGLTDLDRLLTPLPGSPSTAAGLIERHRAMIQRAHALGLKIFGGTIAPFEGSTFPETQSVSESARVAVNDWIRMRAAYDAVIDFDLALKDPQHPTRLLPAYDSGDHLHPNEAGSAAMADAVDLSLFDE